MNLVERVKSILLKPQTEWEVIKGESYAVKDLYMKYAVLLAAIPAVAAFIGFSAIGISTGFGSFTLPVSNSLTYGVVTYVLSLVGVYLLALVMDFLAPNFGSTKNMEDSVKIVVFSYTASWIGGIFMLIPSLSILASLAGVYSLVLLYMGMQKIKEVPREKMVAYFVVTLIGAVIITVIISTIVSSIAFGGYGSFTTAY